MSGDTILAALILAGLVNGLVAGLILLPVRREPGPAIGGLLIVAALAGALILFAGDLRPEQMGMLLVVELCLTIAAGPLLLLAVFGLLGQQSPRRLVALAIGLLFAATVIAIALLPIDPVIPAAIMQMAMTCAAWFAFSRRERTTDRRTRKQRLQRIALALLIAISLLHGAQVARMAAPAEPALRWAVPGALALVMAIATAALLAAALRKLRPAPMIALSQGEAVRTQVEAWLEANLANPRLTLACAAGAFDLAPGQLRDLFAPEGGFAATLRRLRIASAASELADVEERRTSIEAIGLGCGFRSRSAFYEAFRKETGLNPGEYRRKVLG